jgi:hypothetical protein
MTPEAKRAAKELRLARLRRDYAANCLGCAWCVLCMDAGVFDAWIATSEPRLTALLCTDWRPRGQASA